MDISVRLIRALFDRPQGGEILVAAHGDEAISASRRTPRCSPPARPRPGRRPPWFESIRVWFRRHSQQPLAKPRAPLKYPNAAAVAGGGFQARPVQVGPGMAQPRQECPWPGDHPRAPLPREIGQRHQPSQPGAPAVGHHGLKAFYSGLCRPRITKRLSRSQQVRVPRCWWPPGCCASRDRTRCSHAPVLHRPVRQADQVCWAITIMSPGSAPRFDGLLPRRRFGGHGVPRAEPVASAASSVTVHNLGGLAYSATWSSRKKGHHVPPEGPASSYMGKKQVWAKGVHTYRPVGGKQSLCRAYGWRKSPLVVLIPTASGNPRAEQRAPHRQQGLFPIVAV